MKYIKNEKNYFNKIDNLLFENADTEELDRYICSSYVSSFFPYVNKLEGCYEEDFNGNNELNDDFNF